MTSSLLEELDLDLEKKAVKLLLRGARDDDVLSPAPPSFARGLLLVDLFIAICFSILFASFVDPTEIIRTGLASSST